VDRIDLYQMHWPAEDGTGVQEYWQTFADLKREGKVRAIGLSNHSVSQLEQAEAIEHVDAIQSPFSLIHRRAADDVLPWAREHQAGAIVYSPMASGLSVRVRHLATSSVDAHGFRPSRNVRPGRIHASAHGRIRLARSAGYLLAGRRIGRLHCRHGSRNT
jgi:aryl-alcohol dehydrogenase-like predicted oxidoreductase